MLSLRERLIKKELYGNISLNGHFFPGDNILQTDYMIVNCSVYIQISKNTNIFMHEWMYFTLLVLFETMVSANKYEMFIL